MQINERPVTLDDINKRLTTLEDGLGTITRILRRMEKGGRSSETGVATSIVKKEEDPKYMVRPSTLN